MIERTVYGVRESFYMFCFEQDQIIHWEAFPSSEEQQLCVILIRIINRQLQFGFQFSGANTKVEEGCLICYFIAECQFSPQITLSDNWSHAFNVSVKIPPTFTYTESKGLINRHLLSLDRKHILF